MRQNIQLGLDIGGTGIKGGLIDVNTGYFKGERIKIGTPIPATPKAVARVVNDIINHFEWEGPVGCGFPAVINHGICGSASNIPKSWVNKDLVRFFKESTGLDFCFANDADLAGLAELAYGDYNHVDGTIIFVTLGTGIGSALFRDGKLLPNTEFGHLLYRNSIFEHYASNNARKTKKWSYNKWGVHLNAFINHLHHVLSPDQIILGGGISKRYVEYKHTIKTKVSVSPARLQNNAGIIGAASMCSKGLEI